MTFDGRTAITTVMLVIFAGASFLSLSLPQKAAFMPLLVAIPGTILCMWQLALDLRRAPSGEEAAERDGSDEENARSEAEIFFWLGAFSVSMIGFGFVVGGPLAVLAFIRFASRESWLNAVIAGLGTLAVTWGVFVWLLEMPLFQGLVLEAVF